MTSARETAKNRKFLCIHYTTVTERFPWKQGTYKYSVSTNIGKLLEGLWYKSLKEKEPFRVSFEIPAVRQIKLMAVQVNS